MNSASSSCSRCRQLPLNVQTFSSPWILLPLDVAHVDSCPIMDMYFLPLGVHCCPLPVCCCSLMYTAAPWRTLEPWCTMFPLNVHCYPIVNTASSRCTLLPLDVHCCPLMDTAVLHVYCHPWCTMLTHCVHCYSLMYTAAPWWTLLPTVYTVSPWCTLQPLTYAVLLTPPHPLPMTAAAPLPRLSTIKQNKAFLLRV